MIHSLQRLSYALLTAFAVVALTLGYWTIVRGDSLLARGDNPRQVIAEQRIRRGEILDRQGRVLAESTVDPDSGMVTRNYASPSVAPVVGYYSLRYGVSGAEAAADDFLRGEGMLSASEQVRRDLLHQPPVGGDVRLTVDLEVQEEVAALLEGQTGAAVVVTVPDGEVLAMASAPTFDPNRLNEDWEMLVDDARAPLLNRGTQGRYQPGEILQSVILGIGLNTGAVTTEDAWYGSRSAAIGDIVLPCAGDSARVNTLGKAFIEGCPAPFGWVANAVGEQRLAAGLSDYGLLSPPPFALPTGETAGEVALEGSDLTQLGMGQSGLTVSPLQMALVAAGFADNGQIPAPQLVAAQRAPGGKWAAANADGSPRGTISRVSVEAITQLMADSAQEGAAAAADTGELTVYGHAGLAASGEVGRYNAWFIGFVKPPDGQAVATAVLLEDTDDVDLAARIGGEALRSATAAYP